MFTGHPASGVSQTPGSTWPAVAATLTRSLQHFGSESFLSDLPLEGRPVPPGLFTSVCQVVTGTNLPEAQPRCGLQDSVKGPGPPVREGRPMSDDPVVDDLVGHRGWIRGLMGSCQAPCQLRPGVIAQIEVELIILHRKRKVQQLG